jgi:D-glycero-D-manno-heptose 1,7-bisphosphate phosphatase
MACPLPRYTSAELGKYLKDDFSRKPHPGMIRQAQKELSIDLMPSVLIGDEVSDIQAGIAAGVGTNLLFVAECPNELDGLNYELISTLREAISYLQEGA